MKRHFYKLGGESLAALNKLVEYDKLLADFNHTELRKLLAAAMGKPAPVTDPLQMQATLSSQFSSAQVRGYKEKLGFVNPTVQVRCYGDGILYRAYHVFPKMAMSPGTSKANFGLGDLFKNTGEKKERIAIYTAYEDYKGNHFAPPDAIKLTDEQFGAFAHYEERFEYYRTYDEGIAVPEDFDPKQHQSELAMRQEDIAFSHVFLVCGETHDAMNAYANACETWHQPYQNFRDEIMPPILAALTPYSQRLNSWIEDPVKEGERRTVSFKIDTITWDNIKGDLTAGFELQDYTPLKMDGCQVRFFPRIDTEIGRKIAEAMATVPPLPVNPEIFGFKERPTLKNSFVSDEAMIGFPYMKIERYENSQIKLLAFRLPENIKTVNAPKDCTPLSMDDYEAIAGSEQNFDENDLPTHVFRIEGNTYALIQGFEDLERKHNEKHEAFKEHVTALIQNIVPACEIEDFGLCNYKTNGPRDLRFVVRTEHCAALTAMLKDHFEIKNTANGYGYLQNWTRFDVHARRDTDQGLIMAQMIDDAPYERDFPREIYTSFGFLTNKGYDQMKVEKLRGLAGHTVLYKLPDYITDVDPPPGCVALTLEEYTLLMAESHDLSTGSPPAPRPLHLTHLPFGEHSSMHEGVLKLKKEKDKSGLPLHERSEFNWFQIR